MSRQGLSRDRVLDAAAAIADVEGLAALTLSRVAQATGVKPPSLYVHVPGGLADVLAGLRLRALLGLTAELRKSATGKSGAAALEALATTMRAWGKRHPGLHASLVQVAVDDPPAVQEAARDQLEVVLAVLDGCGLQGSDALHAARALRASVRGFTDLELQGGFGMPFDVDESFRRLVALLARGLDGRTGSGNEALRADDGVGIHGR